MAGACRTGWLTTGLNEVQFPKKLRPRTAGGHLHQDHASMKCSSRRNCDPPDHPHAVRCRSRLNEVQFPKELRRQRRTLLQHVRLASMKCSSRRNCDVAPRDAVGVMQPASMKCSSRRNCDIHQYTEDGYLPGPQ